MDEAPPLALQRRAVLQRPSRPLVLLHVERREQGLVMPDVDVDVAHVTDRVPLSNP